MWVRFDDHADAPDGTRIYENSTVLVLRTRWGKVVEQHDFYVDTQRISTSTANSPSSASRASLRAPDPGRLDVTRLIRPLPTAAVPRGRER